MKNLIELKKVSVLCMVEYQCVLSQVALFISMTLGQNSFWFSIIAFFAAL